MANRKRQRHVQPFTQDPASRLGDLSAPDRFRPWLLGATCALFVAQPLVPSEAVASQGDGLPVVMLWITLAVFWLLGAIGPRRFRIRFGWTEAAVLLLVGWHTLASLWAAGHGSPRPAVNMLWQWVGFGLSFFLLRQFVSSAREGRAVAVVMIALAVALGGYGLYQYWYELPAARADYQRDPDAALKAAGLWFEPASAERMQFEKRLYSTEPLATFALANSLAGYLAPWLILALGISLSSVPDAGRRLWVRVAAAACSLPIALCLLLTKSRSAYVAALVGVPLVWWGCRQFKPPGGWRLLAVVAAAAAVLAVVVVSVGGLDFQVVSEASLSLGYRMQYWRASMAIVADYPLAGGGPGQFQNVYPIYKLPRSSEEIADPHNFLLEVWATAGTPAMLALVGVLGCFGWAVVGGRGGPSRPTQQPIATDRAPSQQDDSAGRRDAAVYVLGGGVCGFLLSLPLGWMNSAPPGPAPVLVGVPLAVAAAAVLHGWIDRGRMPAMLPVVAVIVLLVNLSAAGGINYPGVAGTLWVLLALGLNTAEGDRLRAAPRGAAFATLAAALLLALACYWTAYSPVLNCRAKIELAKRALSPDPSRAEEILLAAAAADPLDAAPWSQLAALAFLRWQRSPTPAALVRLKEYQRKTLELNPRSAATCLVFADRLLTVSEKTGHEDDLQDAIALYRRAVALYPNSALHRAKLAGALRAAGDEAGFRQQAGVALWLDQVTPHADKKLPEELRANLKRSM